MHENIIVKQKLNATVEKVWDAITDKENMKKWYFDIPDFKLEMNQAFNFYEPGGENKYLHHGEILEIIPQQKLKHSWTYPEYTKDKTLVKWELTPEGDGTVLTLTHKGLENFEHLGTTFSRESFEEGWKEIVEKSLKEFVEN